MSTILFILAVAVLIIIVMAHIPGVEHFVKPIISLLFTLLQTILVNAFDWAFFVVKAVWFSHLEMLRNLIYSAETLDPTIAVKATK